MTTPMYRDIADQLRLRIESGEFDHEEAERAKGQLPTEQNLQKHYGVSRNTIRDAIKQLTTFGLVETRPGQGTFVVPPVDPFVTTLTGDPNEGGGGGEGTSYASEVEEADRQPYVSPIQIEIQEASPEVAAGLWVPIGTEVISRTASGTSMEKPGPWRRPSTQESSPTAALRGYARRATSRKERSGTCRRRSVSARLATETGSPYAHQTRPKWTSSHCRRMDG